jgi:autoinducer-2 kinase
VETTVMNESNPEGHRTTGRADGYVLAIDAGTGSCRAVLFDVAGTQISEGRQEWTHPSDASAPGSQVFNTQTGWQMIADCVREAVAGVPDPGAILAVSSCGMGGGLVLYDGSGNEVWACANGDARAEREAGELLATGEAEGLYRAGGGWLSLDAPPRLRWVGRNAPDLFASVRHLSMIGDWVTYRLSGEFALDPSMGSTSGMFDLAARDWSAFALDVCALAAGVVPPVVDAGTVVGRVTEAAAAATGLRPGTPVVAGGADTALALIGTGRGRPHALSVTGGSFWKQSVVVEEALVEPDGRLRTTCHVLPSAWLVEGIAFSAGLALRWLRDRQPADRGRPGTDPYVRLEEQGAAIAPGAGGVRAATAPTDAWRWSTTPATFLDREGTRAATSAPGVAVRAIEEAAAFTTRAYVEAIEALLGMRFAEATFTGGAARGTLWPRIVADVLGIPVRLPGTAESAARGAAACACVGAGVYPRVADVPGPDGAGERVVEPVPATAEVYGEIYRRWYAGLLPAETLREAR